MRRAGRRAIQTSGMSASVNMPAMISSELVADNNAGAFATAWSTSGSAALADRPKGCNPMKQAVDGNGMAGSKTAVSHDMAVDT